MHPAAISLLRRSAAVLTAVVLTASGLTACTSEAPSSASEAVGSRGVALTLDDVAVSAGPAVAAAGTRLTMTRIEPDFPSKPLRHLGSGGAAVRLRLDKGQQPAAPVTIRFTVRPESGAAGSSWAVVAQSEGAGPTLLPAVYDAKARTVTAVTRHFSSFMPVFVKVADLVKSVSSFVLKATGAEFEEPDCTASQVELDSVRYTIGRSSDVIPCLKVEDGQVRVDLQSITGRPLTATPSSSLAPFRSVSLDSMDYLNQAIGTVTAAGSNGTLLPGGTLSYRLRGPDRLSSIEIRQNPALLLAVVLEKTADAVLGDWSDFRGSAALGRLKCGKGVSEIVTKGTLDADAASALTREMLGCLGPIMSKAPPTSIVWALITAAPALLVSLVLGAISEITGTGTARIELDYEHLAVDVDPDTFLTWKQDPPGYRRYEFSSPDGTMQCEITQGEDSSPWGCIVSRPTWRAPNGLPGLYGMSCAKWKLPIVPGSMIADYPGGGFYEQCDFQGSRPAGKVLPLNATIDVLGVRCTSRLDQKGASRMSCSAPRNSRLSISRNGMTFRQPDGWIP